MLTSLMPPLSFKVPLSLTFSLSIYIYIIYIVYICPSWCLSPEFEICRCLLQGLRLGEVRLGEVRLGKLPACVSAGECVSASEVAAYVSAEVMPQLFVCVLAT
jgi:hypothetical protein